MLRAAQGRLSIVLLHRRRLLNNHAIAGISRTWLLIETAGNIAGQVIRIYDQLFQTYS